MHRSEAKEAVEKCLRRVMVRTERLAATPDRGGMVEEVRDSCIVMPRDLRSFCAVDRVARSLGAPDAVEYWKSAPYILNCMDKSAYDLKRRLEDYITGTDYHEAAEEAIRAALKTQLKWDDVNHYRKIDPANGRLRVLMRNTIDTALWRLLWIPPSLPYCRPAREPYSAVPREGFTKSLVFSAWQVVPKVIAMLCSYEAERRAAVEAGVRSVRYSSDKRSTGILRFDRGAGGFPENMANLTLAYPCWTLATMIDPAKIAASCVGHGAGEIPEESVLLKRAAAEVRSLLSRVRVGSGTETCGSGITGRGTAVNKRSRYCSTEYWTWMSMAALDAHYSSELSGHWLHSEDCCAGERWSAMVRSRSDDGDSAGFREHVEAFVRGFDELEGHNRSRSARRRGRAIPERVLDGVAETLAKVAIGSPAVVTLRAMCRLLRSRPPADTEGMILMSCAAKVALAFRDMFNLPESSILVQKKRTKTSDPYRVSVLDYCISGNLQSVMDEYLHVLSDSTGTADTDLATNLRAICDKVCSALTIRTVALDFDEISYNAHDGCEDQLLLENHRIRCKFAIRLGDGKDSADDANDRAVRSAQVMSAFNSPFRPFILATTSTGQEGVDLHQYCHEVYHWNLPTNPVDLEQRDGRVHRYKCHTVRRNLALDLGMSAVWRRISRPPGLADPWGLMFQRALRARGAGRSDLEPFWVYEPAQGYRTRRHVASLPMSWEIQAVNTLHQRLALYRMAFGQPRQQDLVEYLQAQIGDGEIPQLLKDFRIDLSPPSS